MYMGSSVNGRNDSLRSLFAGQKVTTNMYVCVYIYIYIYTHLNMYIYTHLNRYIYTHLNMYICVIYIYIHVL